MRIILSRPVTVLGTAKVGRHGEALEFTPHEVRKEGDNCHLLIMVKLELERHLGSHFNLGPTPRPRLP